MCGDRFERLNNTPHRTRQCPVGAILVIALVIRRMAGWWERTRANTRFAPTSLMGSTPIHFENRDTTTFQENSRLNNTVTYATLFIYKFIESTPLPPLSTHPKSPPNSASISSTVGRLDFRFSGRDWVICRSHWATPIGLLNPAREYSTTIRSLSLTSKRPIEGLSSGCRNRSSTTLR